jgi:predicted secreted hydrolase
MMPKKRFLTLTLVLFLVLTGIWLFSNPFSRDQSPAPSRLIGAPSSPEGFKRADGSHRWDFPADFGPHPEYQTEWWYYTGTLEDPAGRSFGYQLTLFRRGLLPPGDWVERASSWSTTQVFMGHFALSDIRDQEHHSFERFSRGAAGLAGAEAEPLRVWLENWAITQTAPDTFRLQAEQDGIQIDLTLADQKGLIFHGEEGYSQKGPDPGNASYYVSQTRLKTTGTIQLQGEEVPVTGLSWMDHEFSTSALSEGQVGWDWFSIQLENDLELMVFQIRRADGGVDPYSSGTLVLADGETLPLDQDQFAIQVTNTWRSPHTGADYPAGWVVRVPDVGLTLEIQPRMADQEMDVSYAYWEGAVLVSGSLGSEQVTGTGYVELTGYAGSMEGEF